MGGLVAFKKGNKALSQTLMRARVVAQGATVAVMLATSGKHFKQREKNLKKINSRPRPKPTSFFSLFFAGFMAASATTEPTVDTK